MEIPSLYIHIHLCERKCPYCDFASVSGHKEWMEPYLEAVEKEFITCWEGLSPKTIYVGGGTPTVFSQALLRKLLEIIERRVNAGKVVEFTFEANPGTLSEEKLQILIEHGVNRLSLGIQSFNPVHLKTLGRSHTVEDNLDAVRLARKASFENLSIDLIFGIPGENLSHWRKDLERALLLEAEHISTYCLTYEKGTPMERAIREGRLRRVSEDDEAKMFKEAIRRLKERGYEHYEISNFSLPSRRSLHNLTYWHNYSYAGVGAAATSYINFERRRNISVLFAYIEAVNQGKTPIEWRETLSRERRARETAMLMLRMREGISIKEFHRRTGFEIEGLFTQELKKFVHLGFLRQEKGRVALTEEGVMVADSILAEIV